MEPDGSLPCSQQPVIGIFAKSDESSVHPHTLFLQGPF
jgi:hypothetical protein